MAYTVDDDLVSTYEIQLDQAVTIPVFHLELTDGKTLVFGDDIQDIRSRERCSSLEALISMRGRPDENRSCKSRVTLNNRSTSLPTQTTARSIS